MSSSVNVVFVAVATLVDGVLRLFKDEVILFELAKRYNLRFSALHAGE